MHVCLSKLIFSIWSFDTVNVSVCGYARCDQLISHEPIPTKLSAATLSHPIIVAGILNTRQRWFDETGQHRELTQQAKQQSRQLRPWRHKLGVLIFRHFAARMDWPKNENLNISVCDYKFTRNSFAALAHSHKYEWITQRWLKMPWRNESRIQLIKLKWQNCICAMAPHTQRPNEQHVVHDVF